MTRFERAVMIAAALAVIASAISLAYIAGQIDGLTSKYEVT